MALSLFSATASLSDIQSRAKEAQSLAKLVKDAKSGRSITAAIDGGTVKSDRILVAASAKFQAEIKGLAAAGANAVEANSLLQTADAGLAQIEGKLDELIALTKSLTAAKLPNGISSQEGAQLDAQFKALKAEIDVIANNTSFEGTKLLAGGGGAGGEFETTYRVGTGVAANDDITISIAKADVAGISSALDTGNLRTQAAATTAYSDAQEAKRVVQKIRGGISGDLERFGAAQNNAAAMGARAEGARASFADPTIALDFSQLTADQVVEESGVRLTAGAKEQLQKLLARIDNSTRSKPAAATDGDGSGTTDASAKSGQSNATKTTTNLNAGGGGDSSSRSSASPSQLSGGATEKSKD
jgi:flagellin